eukprot:5251349-Lingulodinium_polyedra.AAC.1
MDRATLCPQGLPGSKLGSEVDELLGPLLDASLLGCSPRLLEVLPLLLILLLLEHLGTGHLQVCGVVQG